MAGHQVKINRTRLMAALIAAGGKCRAAARWRVHVNTINGLLIVPPRLPKRLDAIGRICDGAKMKVEELIDDEPQPPKTQQEPSTTREGRVTRISWR